MNLRILARTHDLRIGCTAVCSRALFEDDLSEYLDLLAQVLNPGAVVDRRQRPPGGEPHDVSPTTLQ
jgi:hypothetical protein